MLLCIVELTTGGKRLVRRLFGRPVGRPVKAPLMVWIGSDNTWERGLFILTT
jgi:hypothetical protein